MKTNDLLSKILQFLETDDGSSRKELATLLTQKNSKDLKASIRYLESISQGEENKQSKSLNVQMLKVFARFCFEDDDWEKNRKWEEYPDVDRNQELKDICLKLAEKEKDGEPNAGFDTISRMQRQVFTWFMRRYDVASAMRILVPDVTHPFIVWLLLLFPVISLLVLMALICILVGNPGKDLSFYWPLVLIAVYTWPYFLSAIMIGIEQKGKGKFKSCLIHSCCNQPQDKTACIDRVGICGAVLLTVNAWIPRLLVLTALGAIATIDSALIKGYLDSLFGWTQPIMMCGLIGFVLLEMYNRVRPSPNFWVALLRALNIVSIGLVHSSTVLLVLMQFSSTVMSSVQQNGGIGAMNYIILFFSIGVLANSVLVPEQITDKL